MVRNSLRKWLCGSRRPNGIVRRELRVNRLEDRTVPASISGTIYQDWAANGIRNANDPGIAGQRAFIDLNNNGVLNGQFSATDTPIAIPDFAGGVPGLANSSVTVSDAVGNLTDIDVQVTITHTFDRDLILTLVGPNGTRVLLSNRYGGGGDNYIDTVFSDQAGTAISTGVAPFTGSYTPDEALSAFNGLTGADVNGNWLLEVTDNEGLDIGTIQSFKLIVTTDVTPPEPLSVSDAAGLFTFANLAAGNYTIRSIVDGGIQNATGPASYTVALGATDVTGQDFGRTDKNAIYGVAFNDADNSGTLNGADSLTPGVLVYFDTNGNSQFDSQTRSVTAADTPLDIPDFDGTTGTVGLAVSSLAVSGITLPIDKVTVTVNITHTFDGDLILTLISPNGTRVVLSNRRGGSGDGFTNTVFDDAAATGIGTAGNVAPFTGSYRPDESLSVLSGLAGADVNGTWSLEVTDNGAVDVGTIDGFTLDLIAAERNTATDALGDYKFSNMTPGTYSLRAEAPAGTSQTAPAGGAYAVTLAAGGTSNNRDFGFGTGGGGGTTVTGVDIASFYNSGLTSAVAQRSRIDQLRVVFSSIVTFTGTPGAAFSLQRTTGAGGAVGLNVVTSIESGHTVATLTFTNNTESGSLVDGRYTLNVLASGVTGLAQNYTQSFHRRYGDANGDERVDIADFGFFSTQYLLVNSSSPSFLGYFMFNIDGGANQLIDITEFGQFSTRYLQPFNP